MGLETSARWEGEHWQARVNYTATVAEYRDGTYRGKKIPLVPEHVVSGSVNWMPRQDLSLGLEGRYVSASPEGNDFENTQEELPSHTIFNALIRWEARENLSLFVRANNLFDRQYASLKYQGQWYPAAGRQVMAGARWKF